MNANELKRGDCAVVLKVDLPMLLKARLHSLGIFTGTKFSVLKVSLRKKTYLLQAGSAKVAIDGETARGIRVWKT